MALYLLNISIDTPDPQPQSVPENLAFNDQESIIEIIVEQVLGYEDAIKEYDDHDSEEHNSKTNIKIEVLPQQHVSSPARQWFAGTETPKFYGTPSGLSNGFYQLDTPPPKA